jgi:hypothetical protein
MDHQVGAEVERPLQDGRAETVIDGDQNAPAWAIAVNARISAISVSGLDGVSRKNSFVSGRIAASQAAGSVCGTKVVVMPVRARMFENNCTVAPNRPLEATMWSPFFRCASTSRHDRRHAAGRGDAVLGAFQRGEALLEHGDGRIGEAGVDVAFLFAGKALGGLRGALEDEAGGQVQRLGMLAELAALLAGANGQRLRAIVRRVRLISPAPADASCRTSCCEAGWPSSSPSSVLVWRLPLALAFDGIEIVFVDVAGDVATVEAGSIEIRQVGAQGRSSTASAPR